ncbi:peptide chain release factor H [Hyphomicrobium sp. DMF-1]|jgi:peptide chain release factor|uniref:peptide chain release factor H n=1 Tax=Hyphomicrobium sp. DMF-1 TaxID=3019544 RepID=UPI0022EBC4A9|nr:peptide chain release factor H [Hyphomicrobium sp. DMF-1]WBT38224.1 peptide chain release factor H [Hyphomicrobium sp. DMF-1]
MRTDSKEHEHIWLQVTSGRGPAECQLAVARLADVLEKEASKQGLACVLLDIVEGRERGTALSALLSLEGEGARAFAHRSRGSVLWICPSPLRPGHKRKNWFVGVEVLAPPDAGATALRTADVAFEAMRASGPGGQHVNKTESAVRATHRPTGLVATAREERSQAMNKKLALARLAGLLAEGANAAKADAERDRWAQHDALERGRPVRTFEGPSFKERK